MNNKIRTSVYWDINTFLDKNNIEIKTLSVYFEEYPLMRSEKEFQQISHCFLKETKNLLQRNTKQNIAWF